MGDLPLIGRLFRDETLNGVSNELIITVTPHILTPGQQNVYPGPPLPSLPTPRPLPTIPPGTMLPTPQPQLTLFVAPTLPPPVNLNLIRPPVQNTRRLPVPVTNLRTPPPTPIPLPSAFQQTNMFVYGSPPPNNFGGPGDPAQIFYAQLSPTVLSYGTPVTVIAVTTTNVVKLTLSYNGVQTSILQSGAGQWNATFPFTLVGLPEPNGTIMLTLTASKNDGSSASIPIAVSVVPRTSATGTRMRR